MPDIEGICAICGLCAKIQKTLSVEQAVDRAVEECIRKGILAEFLRADKAEVKSMSIFEYDEEAVKKLWKKEFYEDGLAEGLTEGLARGKAEGLEIGRAEGVKRGKKEGIAEGKVLGELQGIELTKKVFRLAGRNVPEEEIARQLSIPIEKVKQILE